MPIGTIRLSNHPKGEPAAGEPQTRFDRENRDSEGGHTTCTAGRVVLTPERDMPYKAVLMHGAEERSEHAFATVRGCEAYIRRNIPIPAVRCTLYDRGPGEA